MENRKSVSIYVMRVLIVEVFLWLFLATSIYAEEQLYFDGEGNLLMTTHDKIATSSTRYKTIGWTIKRYNRGVDDANQSIMVALEDDGAPDPDPADSRYQYCHFKCDKNTIFNRLGAVSLEWQQELYRNGGTVYLDAVMTVVENGVPQGQLIAGGNGFSGEIYRDYEGISVARPWSDPGALRSHFGKSVYFPGNPAMLHNECPYEVHQFECFEPGEPFWNLSRYGKDRIGKIAVNGQLQVSPENFSAYYFQYISAQVCKEYSDGTVEHYWTEQYPIVVKNDNPTLSSVYINLYYKRQEQIAYSSDKYNLQDDTILMDSEIRIGAGSEEEETFDVSKGVPSGEFLYVSGRINPVAYEVKYTKHFGLKTSEIRMNSEYQCHWNDGTGEHVQRGVTSELYYVDRNYSYWEITSIRVYTCYRVLVYNDAFEAEKVMWESGYEPQITIENKTDHLRVETVPECWVDGGHLYGGSDRPPMPKGMRQQEANAHAGYVFVNNDTFSIDEEVLLSGNEVRTYGGDPKLGAELAQLKWMQEGIWIPKDRKNGRDYESSAAAIYKKWEDDQKIRQNIGDVNSVVLHTPVVCQVYGSDEKNFNQLCKPIKEVKTWILGKNFDVGIVAEGQHLDQPGYGWQDYSRYATDYQVCFPFAVYRDGVYCAPGTWQVCNEDVRWYLPQGVKEGVYTVEARVFAYNHGSTDAVEEQANLDIDYYGAYAGMEVSVCGRLYGLQITDIERENWQSVFERKNYYSIGLHNENGELVRDNPNQTFPILQGGKLDEPDAEGEPLGTGFTYQIRSVGDYKTTDGIGIEPEFYVTDESGQNRRRVDVYHFYEEGLTWQNILSHEESNPGYLGFDERSNLGVMKNNVKDRRTAIECVQMWEGTFRVPDDIYVVPYQTDIQHYIMQRGHVDTSHGIFIREGYLLVRFRIDSMKDGEKHLSYINEENEPEGYANMWKIEGFTNPKKRDNGELFALECGDVFIYDLKKHASYGYRVVGTH